ncbi:hypothetical protein BJ742DRAFT_843718 [Cladochytrium replicatum]|nr:hypothetical protein BJ742DRAFT_843718 [Cladochytrium replicatum]
MELQNTISDLAESDGRVAFGNTSYPHPQTPREEANEGRSYSSPITFAVSFSFTATQPEEMDIRIGDQLRCFRTFETGWGYGENLTSGRSGMFPLDSVSVVEKPRKSDRQSSPLDQITAALAKDNSLFCMGKVMYPLSKCSRTDLYPIYLIFFCQSTNY